MATISQGIRMFAVDPLENIKTELTNLQEIPDLGGEVESIEVTTLADAAHMYVNGIKNYGDSLEFKFLYEPQQFHILTQAQESGLAGGWLVVLPDLLSCAFEGFVSVRLDGVGVNSALTYTVSIKPTTEMYWDEFVEV